MPQDDRPAVEPAPDAASEPKADATLEPKDDAPVAAQDPDAGEESGAGDAAAWVGAAGLSGEHVIAGDKAPRLHWLLMIVGPIGLALAIVLSLWNSARFVRRSVNVQVEARWQLGEQLGLRTQTLGADLRPLSDEVAVAASLIDAAGTRHELGALTAVGEGLDQGAIAVPTAATPGAGELLLRFEPPAATGIQAFEERVPVELLEHRDERGGKQVVAESILQWADDTDPQPAEVRIDLRPDGRLLAGFHNRLFVRVTDPAGKPWAPKHVPAQIQVRLISGEFAGEVGKLDDPPVLYQGPVDRLGLASISGELRSDVVRFEIQLRKDEAAAVEDKPPVEDPPVEDKPPVEDPPAAEAKPPSVFTGPKRRLRFVSHAGTVRIQSSADLAAPGEAMTITVEAISARRPVFVDVHGPDGAWLDTFTPPLRVPRDREWTVPAGFAAQAEGSFIQFEAYQSVLRPEDSSAIARIQLAPTKAGDRAATLTPLIHRQREQLSLPRIDKQFEIGRERTYLSEVEAALAKTGDQALREDELTRARAFLIGSLEAVVHGPPQALSTRAREEQELGEHKRRWTVGIRWFLLGGGGLFIFVMGLLIWRNQKQLEVQTSAALGLVAGRPGESVLDDVDDDTFADQSLAIMQARRQVLLRGVLTVALMTAALLLTLAMLESLVWEY